MLRPHAERVADHDHRQVGGDLVDEVALAPLDDGVDDLVCTPGGRAARLSRTRRGVKPLFTSLRRWRWAGSSMSIIIGRGPLVRADAAGVAEHLGSPRHVLDVGVAGDAPHVAVVVHRVVGPQPGQGGVVVAGPEGAAAEVDVVDVVEAIGVGGHGAKSDRSSDRRKRTAAQTGIHTSARLLTRMSDFSSGTSRGSIGGGLGVPLRADRGQLVGHVRLEVGEGLRPSPRPGWRPSRPAGRPRSCGSDGWRGCPPSGRSIERCRDHRTRRRGGRRRRSSARRSASWSAAASACRTRSCAVATAARARSIRASKRLASAAACCVGRRVRGGVAARRRTPPVTRRVGSPASARGWRAG